VTVDAGFRLSPQQEQLIGLGLYGPVTQCALALHGPLAVEELRDALGRLSMRHEILRTTIVQPAGVLVPQQVVVPELPPAWRAIALSAAGDGECEAALRREAEEPFDLRVGAVLRALLITLADDEHVLVLTAPAAYLDPASLLIVADELAVLCDAAGGDPFGEEPVQYADYAEWRHQLAEDGEPGVSYWRAVAAEPVSDPWVLFARPSAGPHHAREHVAVELDAGLQDALKPAASSLRVEVDTFIEACWHAFISRMAGVEEVLTASYANGRAQADLVRALGAFGQASSVLSRYDEFTTLPEIVDQVRRGRSEAARWHDYARAEDLARLAGTGGIGFAHHACQAPERLAGASAEVRALRSPLAGPWLHCTLLIGPGDLRIELAHDPDVLGDDDARELARRLRTLLAGAAADPEQPVAGLPIVEAAERIELVAIGPPARENPKLVHELFASQAARHPGRPAVVSTDGEVTFAELDESANRLAHELRNAGIRADVPVGLCLERVPGLVTAVMAIFKAGGAYVPLNPEHPAERLRHQLEESGAAALVTQARLLERLPAFAGKTICLDRDARRIASHPHTSPVPAAGCENLAYIIYTSGSSALPKGVAVTQGNLANYTVDMITRLGFDQSPGDRGLRAAYVSSISTDLGNTCLFPALAGGGCVQLITDDGALDPDRFVAEIRGSEPDVLKITPSHLSVLLAGRGAEVLPRRWLVLGGEALSWELVDRIRAERPQCRILNHYGPTEATIGCCTFALDGDAAREHAATVPIGAPITAMRAHVIDGRLEPLPAGVVGELCIAGAGVAVGYVNNQAETDARFGRDPLADHAPEARLYRTGDRVRRLRDGNIEFLGRVDQQLKIRGFRIEPGEIEAALCGHEAIRQATVIAPEDGRGERQLVAYFVAAPAPPSGELKAFLAASLPDYMIPARFVALEAMPLTPSGKVDRQALLARGLDGEPAEQEFAAPRDEIEHEIAEIWSELLGVERVSVFDDFFALGGHSLLATQAIMRIRRAHGNIPLHALLGAPTVAALAEVVRGSSIELAS
jgi:amino acid adenylation domain-containing protein